MCEEECVRKNVWRIDTEKGEEAGAAECNMILRILYFIKYLITLYNYRREVFCRPYGLCSARGRARAKPLPEAPK